MGTRSLVLLVTSLMGVASARGGLSLQPHESSYLLEGIKLKQLAFFDGGKEVTYQQPPDWSYSGSSDHLTLHPPGRSQAEASVSRVSLAENANVNEKASEPLIAAAIASAPQGSSDIKIISQGKTSLKISGKESFQVVMSYNLQGQIFTRSITFLTRDHEQLRFQLTTPERFFAELQLAFQGSLCSWQNL